VTSHGTLLEKRYLFEKYNDKHYVILVFQRNPFAFELFFCLTNAKKTHQKLSQMHSFLWRTICICFFWLNKIPLSVSSKCFRGIWNEVGNVPPTLHIVYQMFLYHCDGRVYVAFMAFYLSLPSSNVKPVMGT